MDFEFFLFEIGTLTFFNDLVFNQFRKKKDKFPLYRILCNT